MRKEEAKNNISIFLCVFETAKRREVLHVIYDRDCEGLVGEIFIKKLFLGTFTRLTIFLVLFCLLEKAPSENMNPTSP